MTTLLHLFQCVSMIFNIHREHKVILKSDSMKNSSNSNNNHNNNNSSSSNIFILHACLLLLLNLLAGEAFGDHRDNFTLYLQCCLYDLKFTEKTNLY